MRTIFIIRGIVSLIMILFFTSVMQAQTQSITLRVSKSYHPDISHSDDSTLPIPGAFVIPAELPVVAGEAGEHQAILEFKDILHRGLSPDRPR